MFVKKKLYVQLGVACTININSGFYYGLFEGNLLTAFKINTDFEVKKKDNIIFAIS